MNIHILGICGTFMGGIAALARTMGHTVHGSDARVYPPMSTQLQEQGIELMEGYSAANLQPHPDLVIVGNALSRGNECVEYLLDQGLTYTSGPQWLASEVLQGRHVMAVSGTHGKTTTASMLAFILDAAGHEPGFLIGGVAENFGVSARCGRSDCFVVEADEYDTAFFDKRSKFIHYRPRTLVINNLEFDHADIFHDLAEIQREFHRLVRTIPGRGRIIHRHGETAVEQVLAQGCWTPVSTFGEGAGDWQVVGESPDYSRFCIRHRDGRSGRVAWELIGRHNAENAAAAVAAAAEAGVEPARACAALEGFRSVRRRLQRLGSAGGVTVYDDFAHHPTAIRLTLEALQHHLGDGRIVAVLEPRSNTMRMGVNADRLASALASAGLACLYQPPDLNWDLHTAVSALQDRAQVYTTVTDLLAALQALVRPGDHVVVMSNGGFENLPRRLLERLQQTGG